MRIGINQNVHCEFAVIRGGSFNNNGTNNPLCYRNGNNSSSTNMNVNIGFRVVL